MLAFHCCHQNTRRKQLAGDTFILGSCFQRLVHAGDSMALGLGLGWAGLERHGGKPSVLVGGGASREGLQGEAPGHSGGPSSHTLPVHSSYPLSRPDAEGLTREALADPSSHLLRWQEPGDTSPPNRNGGLCLGW